MFEFLQHQHAGAPRDHETVAVGVVGPRGLLWGLVETGGHCAHRVEQDGERPIELLASAGEDEILLAHADHFRRVADAMVRRRAGG